MLETDNKKNELKPKETCEKNNVSVKRKQKPLKKANSFYFFFLFLLKNLFLSFSNIIVIFVIPIVVFLLATYLYPFFNSFSTVILFPSILISIYILPRIVFRFNNQYLINKKGYYYFSIAFFYFVFNFIWSCLMFCIFVILSVKFWNTGVEIDSLTNTLSPSLVDFLDKLNWGSLLFAFIQISFLGTSIGFFIGLICYKNTSIWVLILLSCLFIFGFSLLSLPGIFPTLPNAIQYLSLVSPFSSSFNLSYVAFNGYNVFDVDTTIFTWVIQNNPLHPSIYFVDNVYNLYNLIIPFIFAIAFILFIAIYFVWNNLPMKNVDEKSKLFIKIDNLNKTSSFKTMFIGVPETFKIDGMDTPYKNYIFNIDDKKYNKFISDLLTNKVKMFKKKTIVFQNLNTLKEIQTIHFNNAPITGIKVKDILNYYKRVDFNKYQNTIPGFDFTKMLKVDINCLDYDSLFYLFIFNLLFNDKKIFIIDNYSLSKISKKAIDIVERKNLFYWLINDITETY